MQDIGHAFDINRTVASIYIYIYIGSPQVTTIQKSIIDTHKKNQNANQTHQ